MNELSKPDSDEQVSIAGASAGGSYGSGAYGASPGQVSRPVEHILAARDVDDRQVGDDTESSVASAWV